MSASVPFVPSRSPRLHRRGLLVGALAATACMAGDRSGPSPQRSGGRDEPAFDPPPADPNATADVELPPASEEDRMDLAHRLDQFAFAFHARIGKRGGNLIWSPSSIALAFAMVHAGARGTTAAELARAFHLDGDRTRLHAALAELVRRWQSAREGLELAVANRLFGEATTPFERGFLDVTDRVFAAPLESVDFKRAAEAARARINGWVAQTTHDRIVDLVPVGGVDTTTRLVLVNAIYFKGAWQDPFMVEQTKPGDFFAPGGTRTASFMHATRQLRGGVGDGARWAELPYAGGQFAMMVIRPDAKDGLRAVEAGLTADKLDAWTSAASWARHAIALPKFEIRPGDPVRLSGMLAELGVRTAFGPSADFTGMAPASEQIQLAEAFHKAFIAVDEKGTEAAAATAVSMRAGSAPPTDPPIPFVVDRPFLFVLRDTTTDAILFMGRVETV